MHLTLNYNLNDNLCQSITAINHTLRNTNLPLSHYLLRLHVYQRQQYPYCENQY